MPKIVQSRSATGRLRNMSIAVPLTGQVGALRGGDPAAKGARTLEAQLTPMRSISRALAVELVRKEGLPLRDAGRILRVSHQRVAHCYVEELDAWSNRKAVIRVRVDADPAKNAAAIERLKERFSPGDIALSRTRYRRLGRRRREPELQ